MFGSYTYVLARLDLSKRQHIILPVTRHPSPVTRHPSPVTRHPSPVTNSPLSWNFLPLSQVFLDLGVEFLHEADLFFDHGPRVGR